MVSEVKVCHFTTVHSADDVRILIKECSSLAEAGYKTSLVYLGEKKANYNNVLLQSAGSRKSSRLYRTIQGAWQVYCKARSLDADVYHFHDPELIFIGLLLKQKGKKVIYDVHEDLPRQILSKHWIPKGIRRGVAWLAEEIENYAAKHFNAVITATPHIAERFYPICNNVVVINNFPLLHELSHSVSSWASREKAVCYVGGITTIRGICEMVNAMALTQSKLLLAGNVSPLSLLNEVKELPGWKQVEFLGRLMRPGVKTIMARSVAGLVVLHPRVNYLESQPIKMFEYMSAGIPVIASEFPLWRNIVEGNGCGICVNPLDVEEIAKAVNWIINHPAEAEEMGKNGRQAVEKIYNWDIEKDKLLALYEKLAN